MAAFIAGCVSQQPVEPAETDRAVAEKIVVKPKIRLSKEEGGDILHQLVEDMVQIPSGKFLMGDSLGVGENDEQPVREVLVGAFSISKFEVTYEQYDLYTRQTKQPLIKARWGRGKQPVVNVSWHDAQAFVAWVSRETGINFRLPSEAEWEYAARAGSLDNYSFGNDATKLCEFGNVADRSTTIGWRNRNCNDGHATTSPVGSFKPNDYGLYDMHGNVWEWLSDCWYLSYRDAPADSRPREKENGCSIRSQRGGSWFYGNDEARSAYRGSGNDTSKSVTVGFRIAHDL